MSLNEKELDIISCMAFDASMSVAQVSEETGLKEHVVRHTLKNLLSEGTIRLRPFVNPFSLGLMEHHVEIALQTPGQEALSLLTKALVEAPSTTLVGEVAGDHHLSAMFLTRTHAGVPKFFEDICRKVPNVSFRKSVAAVVEVTVSYPKNRSTATGNNSVSYSSATTAKKFDELDEQILVLLGSGTCASRRELSHQCGVGQSTIDYRINSLQQRGILLAIGYSIPIYRDGLTQYALRITASRPCVELRQKIRLFSSKHPALRSVLHLTGHYDYILGVKLAHPGALSAFTQELHRHLEPYVSSLEVTPYLSTHKLYVNPSDLGLIRGLYVEEEPHAELETKASKHVGNL